MNNCLKDCKGIVFIDALIGMVILVTALTAMAVAYRQVTVQTTITDDKMYATYLAKQAIEQMKSNDRVKQKTKNVKNSFSIPAEQTYTDERGIVYTVRVSDDISAALGNVTDVLTPLKVEVTWNENQSITMYSYYYNQPIPVPLPPPVDPPKPSPPPSMYNAIYAGHNDAMDKRNPINNRPKIRKGYFYTSLSREYKLWSRIYDETYGHNPATLNNIALTNNWGSDGDMMQFDNILFTGNSNNNTQWDEFSFLVRNDVRSYADVTTDLYSQQWSLPSGYNNFNFDFYIKYIGENATESPSNIQSNDNRLITGLKVKASNTQFYGPTAGVGSVSSITSPVKGLPKITAVVKDGYIQLKNIPKGYYSIGLQWTNDQYYGTNDANALISDLSIKKGSTN